LLGGGLCHHLAPQLENNVTEKEREIYAMLLQICYEILPNTSMRNNKKIKEVLDLVKEHLNG